MTKHSDVKFFLEGAVLHDSTSWVLQLPGENSLSISAIEAHPEVGSKLSSHPDRKAFLDIAGLDQSIVPVSSHIKNDERFFGGFVDLMAGIACLRRIAHSSPLAAGITGLNLAVIRLRALQGGPDVEYLHAELDQIHSLLQTSANSS